MTNRSESEIAAELREAVTQLVVPLQRMQSADGEAFERLHELVVELMHHYKGSDRVSKSLLKEIYVTKRMIAAELDHGPQAERENLKRMVGKLEWCFDLLLFDEVLEDRKPGVPRIL